jgi:hypothetical protein
VRRLIGTTLTSIDRRLSRFHLHLCFTFLARTKQTDDTLERRSQIDSSFVLIRSQTSESTGFGVDCALQRPTVRKPPAQKEQSRSHCVPEAVPIYKGSTGGFSLGIYADLCSLFRTKPCQRESSGLWRIQIPLLPRSPASSQQFSERPRVSTGRTLRPQARND